MRQYGSRAVRLVWIAIALSIVALIWPTSTPEKRVAWSSKQSEPRLELTLARHVPTFFLARMNCEDSASINRPDGAIFDTGRIEGAGRPLTFSVSDGQYKFFVGYQQVLSIPEDALVFCGLEARLFEGQLLVSNQTGKSFEVHLEAPPTVAFIRSSSTMLNQGFGASFEVRYLTEATQSAGLRQALLATALFLVLASLFANIDTRIPRRAFSNFRPGATDALVVVGTMLLTIAGPLFLDDGWVWQTATLSRWDQFYTIFQTWDAQVPIGFFQYLLYRSLAVVSEQLVIFRLVPAACILIIWVLTKKLLRVRQLWDGIIPLFTAVILLTCSAAWLMTLRPEPFIAVLSLIVFDRLDPAQSRDDTPRTWSMMVAGLAIGIGLGIHTSGFVVAAPLALTLWTICRSRLNRRNLTRLFMLVGTMIVTAIFSIFYSIDLGSWLRNGKLFSAAVPKSSWVSEPYRYSTVFSGFPYDGTLRRLFVVLLGITLLLGGLAAARIGRLDASHVALCVGVIGLLITPTKWPWHFGSLSGYLVLAAAISVATRLEIEKQIRSALTPLLFIVSLFVTQRSPESWGFFWPSVGGGIARNIRSIAGSPYFVAVLVVVLALSVAKAAQQSRYTRRLVVASLAVASASFTWLLVAQTLSSSPSIARMNLQSILPNRSQCGLASSATLADWGNRALAPSGPSDGMFIAQKSDTGSYVGLEGRSGFGTTTVIDVFGERLGGTTIGPTLIASVEMVGSETQVKTIEIPEVIESSMKLTVKARSETGQIDNVWILPKMTISSINDRRLRSVIDPYYKPVFPCLGSRTFVDGIAMTPDLIIGDVPLLTTSATYLTTNNRLIVNTPISLGSLGTINALTLARRG